VKIRMCQQMSGSRGDGQPWPPIGGTLIVGDGEGALLCSAGIATPVAEDPPIEIRTAAKVEAAAQVTAPAAVTPPTAAPARSVRQGKA